MNEIELYKNLKARMNTNSVKMLFENALGKDALSYIASVLLMVRNNPSLLECDANSIIKSALQAALLRLSVDPSLGHAYIVPFKNRATFVLGYKGMLQLAYRTGAYRYINVYPVYEGEKITEDIETGKFKFQEGRISDKIVGWLAVFELMNGLHHHLFMTVEEIHEHARKYSPSYDQERSVWKIAPIAMERKTVLRLLLSQWGLMNPYNEISSFADVDLGEIQIPEETQHEEYLPKIETKRSREKEIMRQLGFDDD